MVVKCKSFWEAKKILSENGVSFERVVVDDISVRNWKSGTDIILDGVHIYFMVGSADVAYYTPIMETMRIEDEPRQWHPDILARTHEYKG